MDRESYRAVFVGNRIKRGFGVLVAVVFCLAGVGAGAQTGGAKPTCAAGDAVVWENTSTKAYHLPGDKYYGTTKHGAYACKSAADSAGYHLAGAKSGAKSAGAMTASPEPTASATGSHHKHHHRAEMMASPTPSPAAT